MKKPSGRSIRAVITQTPLYMDKLVKVHEALRTKKAGLSLKDVDPMQISLATDPDLLTPVKHWIKTGIAGVDWAVSNGNGLPLGRVGELWGAEQSGKTAWFEYTSSRLHKQYSQSAGVLYDTERTFDLPRTVRSYSEFDKHRFLCIRPASLERLCDAVIAVSNATRHLNVMTLLGWDSLSQTPPERELEGSMQDQTIGLKARLLSTFFSKVTAPLGSHALLLLINQMRMKIGVMFGDPRSRPGGHALDHASSFTLLFQKIKTEKKSGARSPSGYAIQVKAHKTKLAPPHRKALLFLSFERGIDPAMSAWLQIENLKAFKPAGEKGRTYQALPGSETPVPRDTFNISTWPAFYAENEDAINADILARLQGTAETGEDGGGTDDE